MNLHDADVVRVGLESAPGLGAENITFSVPEIQDLRERSRTLSAFGDFSTIGFTMVGLGEPREVQAGVVGGSYFEVMGLRPALGRLLGPGDDGPNAAGAVVLTHRFWRTSLDRDPSVLGRTVRLGTRSATIVGVLEPSLPYSGRTSRSTRRRCGGSPACRAWTAWPSGPCAEVLAPDRLNTLVFGGFAAVALAIAVVGVAGVLAFSVSARTRELGIRLAVGSQPRDLLTRVVWEGLLMVVAGIAAGLAGGLALARVAARFLPGAR